MSRSKKGSKSCYFETYSKRPGSCFPAGRVGKKITLSKERMESKEIVFKSTEDFYKTTSIDEFITEEMDSNELEYPEDDSNR